MAGFPKLLPAFTAHIHITAPTQVGPVATGSSLAHVAFLDTGSVRSEPGYPVALDAAFVHGADYLRFDPSGRHVRLEVTSLLREKAPSPDDDSGGAVIRMDYTGVVDLSGPAGKVLGGAPDAKTTDFGEAFTHFKFEAGVDRFKSLQEKVFVGSGRFILEEGKPVVVEYKISEVTQ